MNDTDLCEKKFCQKALKVLCDNLVGINIVEPVQTPSCYGDVINWKLPRKKFVPIPLEHSLLCSFLIPDIESGDKLSKLSEWYIQPGMEDLSKAIKESSRGSVKFSNLVTLPLSTGARCFVGSYNNIKLRCSFEYKLQESGTKVTFNILFGTVDLDNCHIVEPKTPAITISREGG